MNKLKRIEFFCGSILLLFFASCSSKIVLEPQENKIAEEKTYIAIGLAWQETATLQSKDWWFTDEELLEEETTITTSYLLLENEALVKNKLMNKKSGTRLHSPLHYIYNQEYFFAAENNQEATDYVIEKSNRELNSYQLYGLYEVKAEKLTLQMLRQKVLVLYERTTSDLEPVLYKDETQNLDLETVSWNIVPGKINYLGDVKVFFQTQRIYYGILLPKVVNKEIVMVGMEFQDNFSDWAQHFQANYPDFSLKRAENRFKK